MGQLLVALAAALMVGAVLKSCQSEAPTVSE
jgi:hypothetical protein